MVLINRRGYSWSLMCRGCGALVQCQNCSIALTYHKSRAAPGMPLLRLFDPPAEAVPEVQRRIHVFRRRRRRARGGISARTISGRAHRAPRPRHGAHQARIPAGARRVREGRNRRSRGHADGGEGPRFPARHAGRRGRRRSRARAARTFARPSAPFSCSRRWRGAPGAANSRAKCWSKRIIPEHYAIQYAAQQDYVSFYEKEAHFRRLLHYPPFTALASVLVRDRKVENAIRWSRALAGIFRAVRGARRENSRPRRRAARPPAPRLPLSIRAEVAAPRDRSAKRSPARSISAPRKQFPETAVIVDVDPTSLS